MLYVLLTAISHYFRGLDSYMIAIDATFLTVYISMESSQLCVIIYVTQLTIMTTINASVYSIPEYVYVT